MSDHYRILLRGGTSGSTEHSRPELRQRLCSVPKMVARDEDLLEFGDADADGVMTLRLKGPDAETLTSIEVEIPRAWVMASGPQVFALVFMVQGWTGWEVYDPQIDSPLQREAVLQGLVAMRQARMQEEGRQVPEPRLEAAAEESPESSADGEPPEHDPTPAPRKRRWRFW